MTIAPLKIHTSNAWTWPILVAKQSFPPSPVLLNTAVVMRPLNFPKQTPRTPSHLQEDAPGSLRSAKMAPLLVAVDPTATLMPALVEAAQLIPTHVMMELRSSGTQLLVVSLKLAQKMLWYALQM